MIAGTELFLWVTDKKGFQRVVVTSLPWAQASFWEAVGYLLQDLADDLPRFIPTDIKDSLRNRGDKFVLNSLRRKFAMALEWENEHEPRNPK